MKYLIFLIAFVVNNVWAIDLTQSNKQQEYNHIFYPSIGFPVTAIFIAPTNIKLHAMMNYDYKYKNFSIGTETGFAQYTTKPPVSETQSSADRGYQNITLRGFESNLMLKYQLLNRSESRNYTLDILIGAGVGIANGTFEGIDAERKTKKVNAIPYETIQAGFEFKNTMKSKKYFILQAKYSTQFYNDSRVPSYGHNDHSRWNTVPTISIGIGKAW